MRYDPDDIRPSLKKLTMIVGLIVAVGAACATPIIDHFAVKANSLEIAEGKRMAERRAEASDRRFEMAEEQIRKLSEDRRAVFERLDWIMRSIQLDQRRNGYVPLPLPDAGGAKP